MPQITFDLITIRGSTHYAVQHFALFLAPASIGHTLRLDLVSILEFALKPIKPLLSSSAEVIVAVHERLDSLFSRGKTLMYRRPRTNPMLGRWSVRVRCHDFAASLVP